MGYAMGYAAWVLLSCVAVAAIAVDNTLPKDAKSALWTRMMRKGGKINKDELLQDATLLALNQIMEEERPHDLEEIQQAREERANQAEMIQTMHSRSVPPVEATKQGTIEKFMLPAMHTRVTYSQVTHTGEEVRCIVGPHGKCLPYVLHMPKSGQATSLVFYCHPNAEDIGSGSALKLAEVVGAQGVAVMAVEYAGYGQSTGVALRSSIDEEMLWALKSVVQDWGVPLKSIVVAGYSIGSGVAAELCMKAQKALGGAVAGLILIAPYSSVKSITTLQALEIMPMMAPLASFMPDNYWNTLDNLANMPSLPVFIGYGLQDGVVSATETRKLLKSDNRTGMIRARGFDAKELFGEHVNEVPPERLGPIIHSTVLVPAFQCPEFHEWSKNVPTLSGDGPALPLAEQRGTHPLTRIVRNVGEREPEEADGIAIDGFTSIFSSIYNDKLYGEQSNAEWLEMLATFAKWKMVG